LWNGIADITELEGRSGLARAIEVQEGQEGEVDDRQFLKDYFERYRRSIFDADVEQQLIALKEAVVTAHASGKKVIIAGNGGSASIASHCAVDFSKNARVRCVSFSDHSLITCLANDYGYDRWLEKALELYADVGDLIILISSSGRSPNMVRAADYARLRGHKLVTFTGFAEDNPLRSRGHLNFWVNSRAYNVVEMTHHIWLVAVCDLTIGSAEYLAS
jgi:D-sedoheptulose 7-phosphate isomerase